MLDAAEREAMILDAAEAVILRHGLGGASMSAIAREAGMSKRTLYTVFKGRTALFAAIVRRIRNAIASPLRDEELHLPLDQRLRLLLTPSKGELPGHIPAAILRTLIAEAERQPALAREFMQEGPNAMRAMIQAELDRSVDNGEIRIGDTASAAALLNDMAHGDIIGGLVSPEAKHDKLRDKARRLDLAIRVFLHGIADRG
ncbi:MAG: TetR/AcrR family transcriptional regulator [Rhodobiaceae bacterium]|nr:TetR/AcrR family transcriptional regulator [Rhodobiaceae bacterium]